MASMKSALPAGMPPTRTSGPGGVGGVAHARPARRRRRRCRCPRPGWRRPSPSRRAARRRRRARSRRGCRRRRATAAATFAGSVAPATRISCGASAPSPMPERSSATSPALALPDFAIVEASEAPSWSHSARGGQRDDDRQPDAGRDEAAARDELGPARPGAARASSVRMCGQSSRGPSVESTTGSSVIATAVETSGISMPPYPIERRNGTGSANSANRPIATVSPLNTTARPADLHRAHDRLVALVPVRALLAPARDDQQRVVDRHAEPDQRDQELDDRRHRRQLVSPSSSRKLVMIDTTAITSGTTASTEANTNSKHDERAEPAEQRLDEHAGAGVAAGGRRQRVEAGHVHRRAADGHAGERVRRRARRSAVGAEVVGARARRVGERVDGAAVAGDERAVAGRGVGGDARAREGRGELRVDAREVGAHAGRGDRLPRRERGDRQERVGLAAVAVALGDLRVGQRALLVRRRVLELQRPRGRARRPRLRRRSWRSRTRRRGACGRGSSG